MNKNILFFLIIVFLLTLIVFNNKSMPLKSYEVKKKKTDTDRSQCNYNQPKVDEMIKTSFGNYILQYPCTAEPKSLTYRYYNKRLDKYDLKLFLSYGDKKASIWVQNSEKNLATEHNFTARLSIGGKGIHTPAENARTDNIEKIKVIESVGLDIYAKNRRVMAQLKNHKDATGNHPTIKCTLEMGEKPGGIFTQNYQRKSAYANCRAYWMLTKDIAVVLYNIEAKQAYDFGKIYQTINVGLQKIIIKRPQPQPISAEEK